MPEDFNTSGYGKPEESPKNGKIRVKLICPLFPGAVLEADSVLLPALDGDILILPNRAPIFLSLRAGRMIVYNKGQKPVVFFVSGGVCEVRRNLCPVLAWGGREEKIDVRLIARYLEDALKVYPSYRSSLAKTEAVTRIDFFKMVLDELHYDPTTEKTPRGKKEKPIRLFETLGLQKENEENEE